MWTGDARDTRPFSEVSVFRRHFNCPPKAVQPSHRCLPFLRSESTGEASSIRFQLLSESVGAAAALLPVSRVTAASWRIHCIFGRAGYPPQVFPAGTSFITPEPPATLPPLPIVTCGAIATLPPRTTKSSSVTLPLRPDCATIIQWRPMTTLWPT